MSKHTPGPWVMVDTHDSTAPKIHRAGPVPKGDKYSVAYLTPGSTGAEVKANARLIAAAPELLEAAKKAENVLADMKRGEGGDHVLSELHAAIAKARGPDA